LVLLFASVNWSAKHYAVLGAFFGSVAFFIQVVKRWKDVSLAFEQGDALGVFGLFLLFLLGGGLIGWFIGWFQANAEKRRRARDKTLIVRR
jgi:hypothetical protein